MCIPAGERSLRSTAPLLLPRQVLLLSPESGERGLDRLRVLPGALRGFDASELDLSLRRQIAITERVRLNLSAEAYNIFNHPSFANPTRFEGANLASPNFGIATQTLNQSISGGTSINATGGARTLELVVRLQF